MFDSAIAGKTRHKCFISYHHDDEQEVKKFIDTFDHSRDIFISRGIGAGMDGDIIQSIDDDYIKQRIRNQYLRDSTVTIVLIGRCTWSRRFVDWEIAASLRNTATSKRNGLLAIKLPSAAGASIKLPERLKDNLVQSFGQSYAQYQEYPFSANILADYIEQAYSARTFLSHLVDNSRQLSRNNKYCR